ncbi:MAG: acetyl-CoA carboxylase biotin carboxyl carrier protein subunit [Anaerolineae bacterium]
MKYEVTVADRTFQIEIDAEGYVTLDGEIIAIDFAPSGTAGLYSLLVNNESIEALVERRDDVHRVLMRGHLYEVRVLDERDKLIGGRASSLIPETGELVIRVPMPGLVVSVMVTEGQQVEKGDTLLILESMKMENELKAPRAGIVSQVRIRAGESVEQNQVLMVLD